MARLPPHRPPQHARAVLRTAQSRAPLPYPRPAVSGLLPRRRPRWHRFGRTDRTSLLNLYKAIQNTIEALDGPLPVVVMEHADLDDEPFRNSVEARWRRSNGQALVPRRGWDVLG
ncbi:DUF3732 domain-containing protein [Nocardia sp. NBC_00881]|uniref:DUF3732 domain-containing protein n=1 Tax=Nocardia sp. NBC_00881 TaxID=2975995 RepID=UPI00386597D8